MMLREATERYVTAIARRQWSDTQGTRLAERAARFDMEVTLLEDLLMSLSEKMDFLAQVQEFASAWAEGSETVSELRAELDARIAGLG